MSDQMTTKEQGPDSKKPRRRWVKPVLIISLALNLLVVGAIAAKFAFGPYKSHFSPSFGWSEGRSFFWKLSHDRRRVVMDEIKQHREEFRAIRETVRAARAEAAARLSDTSSSDADIAQALSALGEGEAAAVKRIRGVMGDVSVLLTVSERQTLAEQILRWRSQYFGPSGH
ncbi:MAG: periplasmic heavy metal sensor [Alphaproteobacteria bacterium]